MLPEADALNILATASFLDMTDLMEEALAVLQGMLSVQNVAELIQFARGDQYYGHVNEQLYESCRALLCRDGYELEPEKWLDIPTTFLAEVARCDAFYTPGELNRYTFLKEMYAIRENYFEAADSPKELQHHNPQPIQDVINGLHFMHLTFEELQSIVDDATSAGTTFVSRDVIQNALWNSMTLRSKIVNSPPSATSLSLTTTNVTPYPIPGCDTTIIGDPFPYAGKTTQASLLQDKAMEATADEAIGNHLYSPFPPFRFGVEFSGLRDLEDGRRVYSRAVRYGGSNWNIYIQKATKNKRPQLGVYLHRTKEPPSLISSNTLGTAVTRAINQPPSAIYTIESSKASSLDLGEPNPPIPCLTDCIDERHRMKTYFRIYCIGRRDTHGDPIASDGSFLITEFNSTPDLFNFSQSWGWKTNQLIDEAGKLVEDKAKFMIVLGYV